MQTTSDIVREKMVKYAKEYYNEHETPPTVVNMVETIPELRNVRDFYLYMKGGMGELCRVADIPVDYERLDRTAKATGARRGRIAEGTVSGTQPVSQRGHLITLSEDLSNRIRGACYIARISDPSRLIGEMLDNDIEMRSYDIPMKEIKKTTTFLKNAKKKGWKLLEEPSILNALTRSQNCKLFDLPPSLILKLAHLVEVLSNNGVRIEEMGRRLAKWEYSINLYHAYKLGQISEDTVEARLRS